jgi:autotransporter strand-loop-strand O-heptosyltransferase
VVLISGFTDPTDGFASLDRVINRPACNSCWNDARDRVDHKGCRWCPHRAGAPRSFACARLIIRGR